VKGGFIGKRWERCVGSSNGFRCAYDTCVAATSGYERSVRLDVRGEELIRWRPSAWRLAAHVEVSEVERGVSVRSRRSSAEATPASALVAAMGKESASASFALGYRGTEICTVISPRCRE